jgi:thiosulfate/3-mercaptopyruvate sulfurtransferase
VTRPAAQFTAREWPTDRLAGIDEVAGGKAVVLDARDRNRFDGSFEPVDPRPGHIPGARNLPAREQLDPDGRFLDLDTLRAQLAEVGVDGDADVITSCGSGVTACHTLLILEAAGLPAGRLYPGSYSQWSNTSRPVATGNRVNG